MIHSKKKLGIGLTVILILVLSAVLFLILAGQHLNWKVTDNHILRIEDAKNGCTYEVFQIFTGDADEDGTLFHLRYGRNYGNEGTCVPDQVTEKAERGEVEYQNVIGEPVAILTAEKPSVELEEGLYVVREGEENSLVTVNQMTVYAASSLTESPEISFKINDDLGDTQITSKYGVGEDIPISMSIRMPYEMYGSWNTKTKKVSKYVRCSCLKFFDIDTNNLAIHSGQTGHGGGSIVTTPSKDISMWYWTPDDTPCSVVYHIALPEGLTYTGEGIANQLKVYLLGSKGSETIISDDNYTVSTDGQDVRVQINDIKASVFYLNKIVTRPIVVTFGAELTEFAASVNQINANITYNCGSGNKTIDLGDSTILTSTLKFESRNVNSSAVDDAGYTLYKLRQYQYYSSYEQVGEEKTGTDFTFPALGTGQYKLVQTTTPAGYKRMDDYEFCISGEVSSSEFTSLKVTDLEGNAINAPGGTAWTADLTTATLNSTIINEIDETQTKEITATVKYDLNGEIQTEATEVLKDTALILETNKQISTAKVQEKTFTGYKVGSITVNGETAGSLPETVNDGDTIIYHYVIDEDQKHTISARVRYVLGDDEQYEDEWSATQEVQVLSNEIDTGAGFEGNQFEKSYDGYKLSKIVLADADGTRKDITLLPKTLQAGSSVIYYYVVDDGLMETLSMTVKYSLKGEIQEDDTFVYSEEVKVTESDGYLKNVVLPEKAYPGYKFYQYTYENGSPIGQSLTRVKNGATVVVYYEIDTEAQGTWAATVQHKCGEEIKKEIPLTVTGIYWDYGYEFGLYTDGITAEEYPGYRFDRITINDKEVVSLPDMLQDGDVVIFHYTPIVSHITVKYLDEYGADIEPPVTQTKNFGEEYETERKEIKGYDILSVTGITSGTVNEENIEVIYRYSKKKSITRIHYLDEKDNEITASDEITLEYGSSFTMAAKELEGYTFAGEEKSFMINYQEDPADIILHYKRKNIIITTKHVFTDGKYTIEPNSESIPYGTEYQTAPLDGYEGYTVSVSGETSGTATKDITITYTYEPMETEKGNVTVQYVDENGIEIADAVTLTGDVDSSYETTAKEIARYSLKGTPPNASGTFVSEPVVVIYIYEKAYIPLTVRYVDESGHAIATADSFTEEYRYQEPYNILSNPITGYDYKELAGNSAPASGTMPNTPVTVTFVYKQKDITITVKHQDESGRELASEEVIKRKYKESYTTSPKDITGYKLKETPANASGSTPAGDFEVKYVYVLDDGQIKELSVAVRYSLAGELQEEEEESIKKTVHVLSKDNTISTEGVHEKTYEGWVPDYIMINNEKRDALPSVVNDGDVITFVYKKADASVTVRYEDDTKKEIKEPKTIAGKYGESYRTEAEEIEGYEVVSDSGNAAGTMNGDITVTYTYRPVTVSIAVKYVDETGKEIADSQKINGSYGASYTDTAPDIPGYAKPSESSVSGTYGDRTEIVYAYQKSDLLLTVRYVDEAGNDLIERTTETKHIGDSYVTSAEEIEGYVLKETPENAKGVMGSIGITVTYVYEPKAVNIMVRHIDADGNEIAGTETLIRKYKEEYSTSAMTVKGYKLYEIPEGASGITPANDLVVSYKYVIDESQTKVLTASVKYSLGDDIKSSDTITLKKTVQVLEKDTKISTKDAVRKEYAGWKFSHITVNGEKVQSLPNTVNAGDEIIYHYIKEEADDKPDNISVITKYVDTDGKELADCKIIKVNSGDRYQTEEVNIEGYKLVSDSGNTKGTAGSKDIKVIYTYDRKDVSVVINYEDESGRQLAASETMTGKYGDNYETRAKEIAGYELISDSGNISGVMKDSVAITYTYRLKSASVTIKYVDGKTGKTVASSETIKGHMFDKYETVAKDISGYTLVKTPANAKGVITEEKVTVIYRYEADMGGVKLSTHLLMNNNYQPLFLFNGRKYKFPQIRCIMGGDICRKNNNACVQ